jgi:hypothetical protein
MLYVTGGEYKDTSFSELAPGGALDRQGPFTTYAEALKVWRSLTGRSVDLCCARYQIVDGEGKPSAPPRRFG